mmetsp:Transcript_26691/g.82989  ORF Transcript_26691/g.82989 Transcript_26691/m.82989 type:complete len:437 (-) Transcript_26691:41-1351(-)
MRRARLQHADGRLREGQRHHGRRRPLRGDGAERHAALHHHAQHPVEALPARRLRGGRGRDGGAALPAPRHRAAQRRGPEQGLRPALQPPEPERQGRRARQPAVPAGLALGGLHDLRGRRPRRREHLVLARRRARPGRGLGGPLGALHAPAQPPAAGRRRGRALPADRVHPGRLCAADARRGARGLPVQPRLLHAHGLHAARLLRRQPGQQPLRRCDRQPLRVSPRHHGGAGLRRPRLAGNDGRAAAATLAVHLRRAVPERWSGHGHGPADAPRRPAGRSRDHDAGGRATRRLPRRPLRRRRRARGGHGRRGGRLDGRRRGAAAALPDADLAAPRPHLWRNDEPAAAAAVLRELGGKPAGQRRADGRRGAHGRRHADGRRQRRPRQPWDLPLLRRPQGPGRGHRAAPGGLASPQPRIQRTARAWTWPATGRGDRTRC